MTRKTRTVTDGQKKAKKLFSASAVEALDEKMLAIPLEPPTEMTAQQMIERLLPRIERLFGNGWSRARVNDYLKREIGLEVSEDTLRGYIRKARAAAENAASTAADSPAREGTDWRSERSQTGASATHSAAGTDEGGPGVIAAPGTAGAAQRDTEGGGLTVETTLNRDEEVRVRADTSDTSDRVNTTSDAAPREAPVASGAVLRDAHRPEDHRSTDAA